MKVKTVVIKEWRLDASILKHSSNATIILAIKDDLNSAFKYD
jgi:hypothetical protein